MQLRFHLDPETQQPHIYDHGVTKKKFAKFLCRAATTSLEGMSTPRFGLAGPSQEDI